MDREGDRACSPFKIAPIALDAQRRPLQRLVWQRPFTGSVDGYILLVEHQASRLFDTQIFVFHFPGVIERVKRSVPNQETERPRASHFVL
jgi:hypothetical protein